MTKRIREIFSHAILAVVMFASTFTSAGPVENKNICEGDACVPPTNGPQRVLVYDRKDKFALPEAEEEKEQ